MCQCKGKCDLVGLGDSKAYRGYVFTKTFHGISIKKGGHHIGFAAAVCEAKKVVDALVD